MKLIYNWREAWKMFSVQANAIGAAIIGAYMALPDEFKAQIPSKWVLTCAGIVFVLGIIGRVVAQPAVQP